jgi:hypothetical protein
MIRTTSSSSLKNDTLKQLEERALDQAAQTCLRRQNDPDRQCVWRIRQRMPIVLPRAKCHAYFCLNRFH